MKISGSVLAFGGRFRESMQNKTALTTALGRPNREQVTTERPSAATTLQALALTNGEVLSKLIKDGAAVRGRRGRWGNSTWPSGCSGRRLAVRRTKRSRRCWPS